MDFTRDQRRTFIALACRIAWADGVVRPEERDFVVAMVKRFADSAISPSEIDDWLDSGVPASEIRELPEELGQLFFYQAMELAQVDNDLADSEVELLETIMQRVFKPHRPNTPLARIALTRKPI